ncbi:glycosyl hydrolase family 28-related protein [Caulobacter segnis]
MGDGRADDTDAVQKAIDTAPDKTGHGLVFLPSGRYRLSRSLLVPPGVRVFGVGKTRPVFVLGRQHARLPGGRGHDDRVHGRRPVPGR